MEKHRTTPLERLGTAGSATPTARVAVRSACTEAWARSVLGYTPYGTGGTARNGRQRYPNRSRTAGNRFRASPGRVRRQGHVRVMEKPRIYPNRSRSGSPGVFGGKGTAGSWKNTGRHRRNGLLRYLKRSRRGAPGVFGGKGTVGTAGYATRTARAPPGTGSVRAPIVLRTDGLVRVIEQHRTAPSERPAPLPEPLA